MYVWKSYFNGKTLSYILNYLNWSESYLLYYRTIYHINPTFYYCNSFFFIYKFINTNVAIFFFSIVCHLSPWNLFFYIVLKRKTLMKKKNPCWMLPKKKKIQVGRKCNDLLKALNTERGTMAFPKMMLLVRSSNTRQARISASSKLPETADQNISMWHILYCVSSEYDCQIICLFPWKKNLLQIILLLEPHSYFTTLQVY